MSSIRPLAVVIMAAGQGKRMQDPEKPKVLYTVGDVPMVGHVLKLAEQLGSDRTVVIVGFGRDQVMDYIRGSFPSVQTVVQEEQLGTGHAVQQAERALKGFSGDVLVLSGDVPLLTYETVNRLLEAHQSQHALASVLTVSLSDPSGYGRIVRTSTGSLEKIVEQKDATEAEQALHEINSGIYVFDCSTLFDVLRRIDRKNAQGEYYLTDSFARIIEQFGRGSVAVASTNDPIEVTGVNTRDQLSELERAFHQRTSLTEAQQQSGAPA